MNFARKQLEKYGWTEGKGLGKNENGISEALKPKLKRSVAGIGHDAAEDFTEHWWSQLYNKAAKNVEVLEKNGKTKKIKTKDENEFEITNSTWKLNRKRKQIKDDADGYADYFVKKAVLANGGSKVERTVNSDSEDENPKKDVLQLTDEELFAACKGRTAHKGARHGLKAIGKLARIAQQEEMLLRQPQYTGYSHTNCITTKNNVSMSDLQIVEDLSLTDENHSTNKKKNKKKKKHCINKKVEPCTGSSIEKMDKMSENVAIMDTDDSNSAIIKKNKKFNANMEGLSFKNHKKRDMSPNSHIKDESLLSPETPLMKCMKKKKKNK